MLRLGRPRDLGRRGLVLAAGSIPSTRLRRSSPPRVGAPRADSPASPGHGALRWTLVGRVEPNPGWYIDDVALEGMPDHDRVPRSRRRSRRRRADHARGGRARHRPVPGRYRQRRRMGSAPTTARRSRTTCRRIPTATARATPARTATGTALPTRRTTAPPAQPAARKTRTATAGRCVRHLPGSVRPDQADTVHPGGPGDACDDPDGDGVSGRVDNCPDTANPGQEDADGDGPATRATATRSRSRRNCRESRRRWPASRPRSRCGWSTTRARSSRTRRAYASR